jgi:hypothetical protein
MRSRDHDVVLVRRTINLGYWEFGMGREWGGVGKQGEISKGSKQGDCVMIILLICIHVYNNCLNVECS